ncbi:MAG: hypothetical protein IKJ75_02985 [Clostridia bacterium]|nr:hypothetical protein [Clostridia bacterium]
MRKLIYKFQQFMSGRNGPDGLNLFLIFIYMALIIANMFVRNVIANSIILSLALLVVVMHFFRMFSRNVYKRRRENATFLGFFYRIKNFFKRRKRVWKERKTHKYKKCPACKAQLRLPKRNCKIQVTCPKCGHKFTMKV